MVTPDQVDLAGTALPTRVLRCHRADTIARARNHGISHARTRWLAFLDSDTVPEEGWLAAAIHHMRIDEADFVQGPFYTELNAENLWGTYEAFNDSVYFERYIDRQTERCFTLDTRSLLGRKSAFERAGLFREEVPAGEDREFGFRASALGLNLKFDEMLAVRHSYRTTIRSAVRTKKFHAHGMVFTYYILHKAAVDSLSGWATYFVRPISERFRRYKIRGVGPRFLFFHAVVSLSFFGFVQYYNVLLKMGRLPLLSSPALLDSSSEVR